MKQILGMFLLALLPLAVHSETYVVGVDHLNLRAEPSIESDVLWKLNGGEELSGTISESVGERAWLRLEYDTYDGARLVGWAAAEYLVAVSEFRPYRPDAPRVVTYPLVDFETAYLLMTDGTFRVIEPKAIDGLYFGCEGAEQVIGNFCIKERGELFIARNVVWARGYKAFRLEQDGDVCSFLQDSLEPDMEDFRTCSTDRYTDIYTRDIYTRLAEKL